MVVLLCWGLDSVVRLVLVVVCRFVLVDVVMCVVNVDVLSLWLV